MAGAIPTTPQGMPDALAYYGDQQSLMVASGYIEPVPTAVWHHRGSGKQVPVQWFIYRKQSRGSPIVGDRRKPSRLGDF